MGRTNGERKQLSLDLYYITREVVALHTNRIYLLRNGAEGNHVIPRPDINHSDINRSTLHLKFSGQAPWIRESKTRTPAQLSLFSSMNCRCRSAVW